MKVKADRHSSAIISWWQVLELANKRRTLLKRIAYWKLEKNWPAWSGSFKYLVANATLFLVFLFHRLILRRVHFTCSNFAWGLHGGADVKWSGGLLVLGAALTWLWLGLKSVEDLSHYPPMGIDSADTSQLSNGEICMGKSHFFFLITQPGQWYRYTSVPMEAAGSGSLVTS